MNTLLGVSSKTDSEKNTTLYVRDNADRLLDGPVPDGTKYYYLADAKGSIVSLVNPTAPSPVFPSPDPDPAGTSNQAA